MNRSGRYLMDLPIYYCLKCLSEINGASIINGLVKGSFCFHVARTGQIKKDTVFAVLSALTFEKQL